MRLLLIITILGTLYLLEEKSVQIE